MGPHDTLGRDRRGGRCKEREVFGLARYSERRGKTVLSQTLLTDRPGVSLRAIVSLDQQAMIDFKGSHFERHVILWAVRWYVTYPISYPQLEEMMEEHGVEVDQATLNRWVIKYVPLLERQFRAFRHPAGRS
jgi:hypothetical protein